MPTSAYLTLKGQKQGEIIGSVTLKGRENSILVHSFDQEIMEPRDPASGLPTGKRQHQPVLIVKEVDKSSPKLWTALVNNETLVTWVLRFWSIDASQSPLEKEVYTVTLTNASIASMREFMEDNQDPAQAKLPLQEQISFTYQKIEWVWTEGAITAQDDWDTPVR
jgi:type VI secretion system secreted protein Hcp